MSKKTAGGILGTLIAAGAVLGVVKYLKDYADVKFTDDSQIDKVKSDSGAVKDAAKRVYIAIREKSDIKEAAGELTKATGSVVTDACDIAKTAGTETVNAFKDMKSRYDKDPETFKNDVSDNLADMTQGIVKATQNKTEEIVDRIRNAYSDFEEDIVDNADELSDDGDDDDPDEEDKGTDSAADEEPAAIIDEDHDNEADTKSSVTEDDKTKSDEESVDSSDKNSDYAARSADGSFENNHVDGRETLSNVTITEDAE